MSAIEAFEPVVPPSLEGTDRFIVVRDIEAADQSHVLWVPKDDIWVSASLHDSDFQSFRLNPINEPLDSIHDVHLYSVRETHDGSDVRTHRLYTVDHNGYRHAVEVTDPAQGEAAFTIFSLPGYTEPIEGAVRQLMHAELARQFPEARIVSIGSNGIGVTGDHYGWNERSLHGLQAMAVQRLSLMKALAAKDKPVFIQATSMGTTIAERLDFENFYGDPSDGPVDIRGQLFLTPALVDPKNILNDMAIRFIPTLFKDLFLELALKTPPRELMAIGRIATRYGLTRRDWTAMGNQLWDLLHGTPEAEISAVVAKVPTAVVTGRKDSLAQLPMWERIGDENPGQLEVKTVESRGHSLALKGDRACAAMAKVGRPLVEKAFRIAA